MPLSELGFSTDDETVYRAMIEDAGCRPEALGVDEPERVVARLLDLGVCQPDTRMPLGARPVSPAAGLGGLLDRIEVAVLAQLRGLAETRLQIAELDALHRSRPAPVVEIDSIERVDSADAIGERIDTLSFLARGPVLAVRPMPAPSAGSEVLDRRCLRRGQQLRVVYPTSALTDDHSGPYVTELAESASLRVTERTIDPLLVLDGSVAVVPADPADPTGGVLVLHEPGVVAGFVELFERTWDEASAPDPGPAISATDRRVLELLASGSTDEASARALGVSVRQLRRTIARLVHRLGASSRFEAGAEATRRGWL